MRLPILVLRPEPGFSATLGAARQAGLDAQGAPLFEIRALDWDAPEAVKIDGLLLGSANALRHGGPQLARFCGKPAHVVGEATAMAAREAGFTVSSIGHGGLQGVIDGLAGQRLTLLRVAGADHVALHPPAAIRLVTRIAYESVAVPLSSDMAEVLRRGAVVLLHSTAAARHFGAECDRLGLARSRVKIAALGPRIAEAAGSGWREVRSAPSPDDRALLALAAELCH
ncbi:MAG: uroporphyrinogen-III synthase [Novosphingobium sp.]|nr:uroporphyrinogen-III synthase [Novosphingobium sp.]MCP5388980.1 uroporphyrinogen-III synthase [Novosphingobium sp.]